MSILINATIKDAHLDCEASDTGKDTAKVFRVITTHTHSVLCLCCLYSDSPRMHEEKPSGHSPTWLPIGIALLRTRIIPSGVSAVVVLCLQKQPNPHLGSCKKNHIIQRADAKEAGEKWGSPGLALSL